MAGARIAAIVALLVPCLLHADDMRRLRRDVERAVAREAGARLRKADLRPRMKAIVPRLTSCYRQARAKDPAISGVINTRLTIRNEPKLGMTLTVNGFETHGLLGESREFLACVTATFEGAVFPAIKQRGSLDVTYPTTFAPQAPDNRDKDIVDAAAKAEAEGRWSAALDAAERGLEKTSLDGPHRHRLVEIGGVAACHLEHDADARRYYALASPEFEDRIRETCLAVAAIDLDAPPNP